MLQHDHRGVNNYNAKAIEILQGYIAKQQYTEAARMLVNNKDLTIQQDTWDQIFKADVKKALVAALIAEANTQADKSEGIKLLDKANNKTASFAFHKIIHEPTGLGFKRGMMHLFGSTHDTVAAKNIADAKEELEKASVIKMEI